jgi:microtubule-associated protein-like 6
LIHLLNILKYRPPCTDVTDVNSTCLTKDKKILATADDFGFVKLFEYPCTGKFAKFKRYIGHSAHVTRVRWTFDEKHLISIGGGDTATMIWENLSSVPSQSKAIMGKSAQNTSIHSDTINKMHKKGESDDSDTDSEDEGYDSDVKREQFMDYAKAIFENPVKHVQADLIKTMTEDAKSKRFVI